MYLQKQAEFTFGDFIESEYLYLCGRGISGSSEYFLPFIGEVIEETWQSASQEILAGEVRDAIARNEHEIKGLSRREFFTYALEGKIPYINPNHLTMLEVQDQVLGFMRTRHMSYVNYDDVIINSPIGSGIW